MIQTGFPYKNPLGSSSMEEIVDVTVDGNTIKVRKGASIQEVLEKLRVKYDGQLLVGLKIAKEQLMLETTSYAVETSKGTFILEIEKDNLKLWREILSNIKSLQVRWISSRDIGLGTFTISLKPRLEAREWEPWDVVVSAEGLEVDNTHIIIVRSRHSMTYALPQGLEKLGRISRGRGVISKLKVGDEILSIKPVITSKQLSKMATKLSVKDRITEPMEILTKIKVKLLDKSPIGAEHFMSAIDVNGLIISDSYSTFVRSDTLRRLSIPLESQARRLRGSVTVRVDGGNKGAIYIYKEACPSSPHHSVVGYVEAGMELLDLAEPGDKISVETEPRRLSLLGLTQAEASEILSIYGITHERIGSTRDEDIVVDQEPKLTFHIIKEGRVKTHGLPQSKILKVKLYYEQAPKTVWYFKALTGLLTHKVGKLKVYFADPMIGFVLFEGNKDLAGTLLPENTPKDKVKRLTIGVTNMSKKFVGLIGIRLTDSSEYGPTGEDFAGTNLIGEVVNGIEALKGVREGSTIYIMEA